METLQTTNVAKLSPYFVKMGWKLTHLCVILPINISAEPLWELQKGTGWRRNSIWTCQRGVEWMKECVSLLQQLCIMCYWLISQLNHGKLVDISPWAAWEPYSGCSSGQDDYEFRKRFYVKVGVILSEYYLFTWKKIYRAKIFPIHEKINCP